MSIKAKCGQCQASFSVRDEFAGKRVKCPKCSQPMSIPALPDAESLQSGSAPTGSGSRSAGGRAGLSPVLPSEVPSRPRSAKPAPSPEQRPGSQPAKQQPARAAAGAMFIGAAGAATGPASSSAGRRGTVTPSNYYNPLLDLLDEAQVTAKARGASCVNCGAEVQPNAIICVECGYNLETGEQLETTILVGDDDLLGSSKMSDAEKILAKAEREIDERPVTAVGQDFGDGSESFLISIVAVAAFVLFIGAGVAAILSMDYIMDVLELKPHTISIAAAVCIYVSCAIWISIVAFAAHPGHGIACVATGGLYCIIFGFMQGKGIIVPSIIMICALLIGLASHFLAPGDSEGWAYLQTLRSYLA